MTQKSMKSSVLVILLIAFFTASGLSRDQDQSRQKRVEVKATDTEQLKRLLIGNKVEAMFRDGTYVKGQVRQVEDVQIVINVKESEGISALPKGEQTVATERISTVQMTKRKGPFRAILTGAGIGGGALLGIGMYMSYADKGETSSGKAAAIALPTGAGIGGYFAGRAIDKVTTTIVIQP